MYFVPFSGVYRLYSHWILRAAKFRRRHMDIQPWYATRLPAKWLSEQMGKTCVAATKWSHRDQHLLLQHANATQMQAVSIKASSSPFDPGYTNGGDWHQTRTSRPRSSRHSAAEETRKLGTCLWRGRTERTLRVGFFFDRVDLQSGCDTGRLRCAQAICNRRDEQLVS